MKLSGLIIGTITVGIMLARPFAEAAAETEGEAPVRASETRGYTVAPPAAFTPPPHDPVRSDPEPGQAQPTPVVSMPMYKPPLGLDSPVGLVAGGSRGVNECLADDSRGQGSEPLTVAVLAPTDHVGLTLQEQPSLYWYLSAATRCQVEVTVTDEQAVQPLLNITLRPPLSPGVQRVRLADHGVRLAPGVQYQWSVALMPDPERRSKDVVAMAFIKRIEPPESLHAQLAQAEKAKTVSLYAEARLWYDALASISDLIAVTPQDAALRQQRATLLEQVRLSTVAEQERKLSLATGF